MIYFLYTEKFPYLKKNPDKSKKGFYKVSDPFLRLWFGSVYPYESFLEFGSAEMVEERLGPVLTNHISYCFEEMCRSYVRNRSDEFDCIRVGRQWGKNYEIDVAGVNIKNNLVVAGECKWSRRRVGMSVLNDLK